ncbi:hypothetical protein L1987_87630 [Smallanthus sonchifolius]|nr:hypothetical protein L1987_87630 [Smallanthus sonchifolius]
MKPGSKTILEKKSKAVKNKTKQTRGKTILEDNLDSNTKQLVVVEDDGYDVEEEEEYLAFCNEYKENEEHDFMISKSGNHLILHAVSQFDAKDESGNVVDNNEKDNDSLKAKKQTMKKNIMTNGSIFYLKSIKEVLDLPIGDIKQMIHLKEVGKNILSKENDTIICIKKFILDEENMQPKYDQTQHNDKVGEWVSGVKYKETCAEVQTSEKNNSQKSHEGSHDGEPIYDETPQTISSIINKDAELDSKQGHEEKVQVEPMQNQAEEDSGEVDITKLIKENNISDVESEKTPIGSRIGVTNLQTPLIITDVER